MPATSRPLTLQRWQLRTGLSLFVGYSAYYLCRSDLAIAAPLLIRGFGSRGLDKEALGQLASVGVLFYAAGKVVNGVLGDFLGGKRIFLLGMVGGGGGHGSLRAGPGDGHLFRGVGRQPAGAVDGLGGAGQDDGQLVCLPVLRQNLGLLSLSYLFGDLVAKLALGQLLGLGLGWRSLFMTAAALLGGVALLNWFTLKSSPECVDLTLPPASPISVFQEAAAVARPPASLGALLRPYFQCPTFLLLLGMSFGLTALREAFSFWVPTYLVEADHLTEGTALQYSALYSLFGMLSILGAGYLSDEWLRGQRGLLILVACVLLVPVLLLLTQPTDSRVVPLLLISGTGLLLLRPYSFLAGAMALDAGGRQGAATAAGLIDAVGYAGGTLALGLTGLLAERWG